MARRSSLRIAFSPTFKKQTAFGTPLANSEITAVLNARSGTQEHAEVAETIEDVFDCTGQYVVDDIVLHRIARLTIDLEVEAQTLAGFLALLAGVAGAPSGAGPYVHTINMLGPTVYTVPVTTFIVGFADGSDTGVVLQDAAVRMITISGRIGENIRARIEIVGNGALPAAVGYTFPECTQPNPLRFTTGSSLLINSVEYLQKSRYFEFTFDQNMPLDSFPFVFDDPDIKRLERGDTRPIFLRPGIVGILTDTLGVAARAIPKNKWPFTLKLGSTTSYVQIVGASALFKQTQGRFTTWDGEVAESVLNPEVEPVRVPGNAATPIVITASLAQSGAFLVAA